MTFDFINYLKDNPLLKENFEKNKWITLSPSEVNKYKDDIFKLIDFAYSYIGGHPNYKSSNDVKNDSSYEIIDLDNDDEIDALNVLKKKPSGIKFTATGHDGSKEAKKAVINHKIEKLNTPGYYIEVSGRIKDILLSAGVPVVTDRNTIEKALQGKEIKFNEDGSYQRQIGGKTYTKILLGKPLT